MFTIWLLIIALSVTPAFGQPLVPPGSHQPRIAPAWGLYERGTVLLVRMPSKAFCEDIIALQARTGLNYYTQGRVPLDRLSCREIGT